MSVAENSIHLLDTSWATTADDRRHLYWELLASDEVRGVFPSARDERLAVLFSGDRRAFDEFESGLHTCDGSTARGIRRANLNHEERRSV